HLFSHTSPFGGRFERSRATAAAGYRWISRGPGKVKPSGALEFLQRAGFPAMIEVETMAAALRVTVRRAFWGVAIAIRERPALFSTAAVATFVLSVALPPLVLSVARTPVDYFTVNPWLRRLPEYAASPHVPWGQKLEKLPDLALFWFSADSPMGGTEWGFAVDVRDVARVIGTALPVGADVGRWARA